MIKRMYHKMRILSWEESYKKAGGLLDAGRKQEAYRLMQKLAYAGYVTAQTGLGVMYDAGIGVEKNPDKAVKWYRRAAKKGNQGHSVL